MTTGQPIRVPSDRNKFNNEFMENLKLQIKINDSNLQANRLYQNTGQLPPSTQMADTRSTTEKLADVEGLKRSIVADLAPIAETSFAYAIINGVLNSPLNVDNSLFRYLAQNASQLALQLSKKYKFGIAGDANDVQLLVEFLNDAYVKTRNTFQNIKGYMNSSTNLRSTNTNQQEQLIQEFKYFIQRLTQLEQEAIKKFGENSPILEYISDAKSFISELLYTLPNQQQMNQILTDLSTGAYEAGMRDIPLYGEMPPTKYDDQVVLLVMQMIERLPNIDQVRTLLNTLEKGIKTNSPEIANTSLFNISQLFEDWIIRPGQNTPFSDALREFRSYFLTKANEEIDEANRVNRISTIRQIEFQNQENQRDANAQRVYVINPGTDPVKVTNGPFDQGGGDGNIDFGLLRRPRGPLGSTQTSQNPPSSSGSSQSSFLPPFAQSQASQSQYGGSQYGGTQASQSQGGSQFSFSDQYPQIYPDDPSGGYAYLSGSNPMSNPKFSDVSGTRSSRTPIYSYDEMKRDLQNANFNKEEAYLRLTQSYPIETMNDSEFDDMRRGSSSNSNEQAYRDLLQYHHGEMDNGVRSGAITPEEARQMKIATARIVKDASDRGDHPRVPDKDIIAYINMFMDAKASQGRGLKKTKKGRGLSSDYREFGINKINHKKLDDGILTLRRGTNSNIPDMPSKRISRKLQKIIKHISGGGMPDFNDINNLEDGEKDYLHKLISKSNLTDRLSVPAPSKDQEEKDFHQFEVMKGEIMSGNDSKELVKKFKLLILKLSKQNILPKNEVNELLQDLLTLGY